MEFLRATMLTHKMANLVVTNNYSILTIVGRGLNKRWWRMGHVSCSTGIKNPSGLMIDRLFGETIRQVWCIIGKAMAVRACMSCVTYFIAQQQLVPRRREVGFGSRRGATDNKCTGGAALTVVGVRATWLQWESEVSSQRWSVDLSDFHSCPPFDCLYLVQISFFLSLLS